MIGLRAHTSIGIFASLAAGVGVDEIGSGTAPATTTLSLALTDSADPVITAVAFSYSLVVTNTGGITATSVTSTVALDASLTYGSASGTGWTVDASSLPNVTFTRASAAVGAQPTITINVTSGGSALTASSTANGSASNASAATPSTQTTVVNLVSKDATSGIRVPASSTEWTNLLAYAGLGISNPNSLWLCQEASGNLADSIGALTLTATSAPSYQTAASGWTRKGVSMASASSSRFTAAAASGPNPTTTSSLWIWYITMATPAATRIAMGVSGGGGSTTDCALMVLATPVLRGRVVNVTTDGTSDPTVPGVQPFGMQYDRTNTRALVFTSQEKITCTYNAGVLDGIKGVGATAGTTPAMTAVYGFMFQGAAAELSSAQVKALYQALGFTIPWS